MKKYPSIVLGAISVCCLISAHVMASFEPAIERSCTKAACSKYFTPAYATLTQNTAYPASGWLTTSQITVPLNRIEIAKNITFDKRTNSFTLPKGNYQFDFQFTMEADTATSTDEYDFRFTDMYLDFNNGFAINNLDWSMKLNAGQATGFNDTVWVTFSGSKVVSVGADNTTVKFILVRDPAYLGNIRFDAEPHPITQATNNHPILINIHKIHGCE